MNFQEILEEIDKIIDFHTEARRLCKTDSPEYNFHWICVDYLGSYRANIRGYIK